jgi:hypothetical protein
LIASGDTSQPRNHSASAPRHCSGWPRAARSRRFTLPIASAASPKASEHGLSSRASWVVCDARRRHDRRRHRGDGRRCVRRDGRAMLLGRYLPDERRGVGVSPVLARSILEDHGYHAYGHTGVNDALEVLGWALARSARAGRMTVGRHE